MAKRLDSDMLHDRLAAWLSRAKPEWHGVTVAPLDVALGSGFSAEIAFIDVAYDEGGGRQHRTLVVRRQSRTSVVFDGDLTLQARMMAALGARGDVPVPPWIGVETDPAVLGTPFLVMGCVVGRVVPQRPNYNLEGWLADETPARRRAAFTDALSAMATLHAIDWRDGFAFLDRPDRGAPGLDQYLGHLVDWHGWIKRGRAMPIVDAAMAHVLANRPAQSGVSVLWGDPTPANTMWRSDGSVAALIDWELAGLGPPELDLAWWMYFDDLFGRRFGVARLDGLPTRDETIALYEQAARRPVRDLDYYDIVVALRMALVAAGAFDRQVTLGNIAADNRSLDANLMTLYLAERLDLPMPELGADFRAFMRNLTPVDEPAA